MTQVQWVEGAESWIVISWPNGSYHGWECSVAVEDASGNRLAKADLVDTNARIVWPAVRPEGAARISVYGQHPDHVGRMLVFRADIVP